MHRIVLLLSCVTACTSPFADDPLPDDLVVDAGSQISIDAVSDPSDVELDVDCVAYQRSTISGQRVTVSAEYIAFVDVGGLDADFTVTICRAPDPVTPCPVGSVCNDAPRPYCFQTHDGSFLADGRLWVHCGYRNWYTENGQTTTSYDTRAESVSVVLH